MTINIALKTSDALVLGCDSVASSTGHYLDPFAIGYETKENGEPIFDSHGKITLKFNFEDLEPIVTNAWGGVTKMFLVHPKPAPMAAVTSGIAKLNDGVGERTIASLAAEFLAKSEQNPLYNARQIAEEFLKFFREKYDIHYRDSSLPEPLREGPQFLIGGYGSRDYLPSLYRVNVQRNELREHFTAGSGVSWAGQSDAVERFIRGYDSHLKDELEAHIQEQLKAFADQLKQKVAAGINELLDKLEQRAPEGWVLDTPDPVIQKLDWERYRVPLDYANLPIQEAVNFVAFLVNIQAGKGRFARGVPTVGGLTHVGVVTREGFEKLNEPKLTHRFMGFGDAP